MWLRLECDFLGLIKIPGGVKRRKVVFMNNVENAAGTVAQEEMKFCQHCGQKILKAAVVCPHCGCQVAEMKQPEQAQPSIVINNSNHNVNRNTNVVAGGAGQRSKNKWVALALCLLLGYLGAHKFYEGRVGLGLLYLFTLGLFGVGCFIDFFVLLFKPNPYYV